MFKSQIVRHYKTLLIWWLHYQQIHRRQQYTPLQHNNVESANQGQKQRATTHGEKILPVFCILNPDLRNPGRS
jgi:hypothetical protein